MKRRLGGILLAALAAGTAQAADPRAAVFAGGCFWCVEADFDQVPGVIETQAGYTGGATDNPTHSGVSTQDTGHYQAVRVTYDPDRVSFEQLLDVFWRSVDPTDAGGQFCERGPSHRAAVFAAGAEAGAAEASRARAAERLGRAIVTPVLPAQAFWPAEDDHQDYYRRNPVRYAFFRRACGRDARLRQLWGRDAAIPGEGS